LGPGEADDGKRELTGAVEGEEAAQRCVVEVEADAGLGRQGEEVGCYRARVPPEMAPPALAVLPRRSPRDAGEDDGDGRRVAACGGPERRQGVAQRLVMA